MAIGARFAGKLRAVAGRLGRLGRLSSASRWILLGLTLAGAAWLAAAAGPGWRARPAGGDSGEALARSAAPAGGSSSSSPTADRSAARIDGLTGAATDDESQATRLPPLNYEDSLWQSQSQNDKRWQAAKMSYLAGLVRQLDGVKDAGVVFDPGSKRSLSAPAVPPAAAVYVEMAPGRAMTGELISAVADLVCGSVAEMARRDVRIIDNHGHSYRAGDAADPNDWRDRYAAATCRQVELDIAARLRGLFAYVSGLVVTVRAEASADGPPAVRAWISVPDSYLTAAAKATGGDEGGAKSACLGRIRRSACAVLAMDDESGVAVDSYPDAAPAPPGADAVAGTGERAGTSWRGPTGPVEAAAFGLIALAWLSAAGVLLARRLRRQSKTAASRGGGLIEDGAEADQAQHEPQTDDQAHGRGHASGEFPGEFPGEIVGETAGESAGEANDPSPAERNPFAFIEELGVEAISAALADEGPQTIALVLAHLPAPRAAAVLCTLEPSRQLDVARRLARLGPVDRDVLAEVARGLLERLTGRDDAPAAVASARGNAERLAGILSHAGRRAEQALLDAIGADQPELAQSVRDRLFAFEDISRLGAEELRPALATLGRDDLAVALRTAGREVRKRIFSALGFSDGRKLKQEMERIGPVRLSDVEEAQRQVVSAIRNSRPGARAPRQVRRATGAATDR